ncbi:MAG: hypothetical protein IH846_16710, partial [Acidobacteria bacterium]|nr:hypothetical protein [Acidobacteriota bacterium]
MVYSETLQASEGTSPYTWLLFSDSLPAGLTLSSGGTISGTPTTAEFASFTVQVTDAAPNSLTKVLDITINNPAPTGNPAPTISSLSPSSAPEGEAGFTLTVTGTGFVAGSVVRWNSTDRSTAFVSSGELQATIPASDIATAGTANVTVFTPSPGGGTSGTLTFTVSACTFAISPSRQLFTSAGGSGTVEVTTQSGCFWTAASNASFITFSSSASGTGSGAVSYDVAENTAAAAREGTLTIGGQTFTVEQAGTAPLFLLRPAGLTFGALEGTVQLQRQDVSIFSNIDGLAFTTAATTTSGGNWLSVNPASGTAPSSLVVSVDPSGLLAGSYQGAVTVTAPSADPRTQT